MAYYSLWQHKNQELMGFAFVLFCLFVVFFVCPFIDVIHSFRQNDKTFKDLGYSYKNIDNNYVILVT